MRTLLILRGAPGCGKSTWVKDNNLEYYTLSTDNIRLMYQSPVMNVDGKFEISQKNNRIVWKTFFEMLEYRMKAGDFTVADATNIRTSELNKYKELASKYRYRLYCVDFTDTSIDEIKRRNHTRDEIKMVPDLVIDKMYARIKTNKVPSGITVIKPDELDKVWLKLFDFSDYKKIHHIGDIHGCNTALQTYFKKEGGLKDDEMYIFLGDYIDRGLENADVLKFLISIKDKKNVLLLEGNHEHWLWMYANGEKTCSMEFENNTKPQLDESGISKKEIRQLYRKLGQCAYYTYNGYVYFVSHGGISEIPEDVSLSLISTDQMIRGVGNYSDYEKIASNFSENDPPEYIQIFGHRNTKQSPINLIDGSVYDLEGRIEFGGFLRAVQLDSDGIHPVEIRNEVYRIPEKPIHNISSELPIKDVINNLRNNQYIQEKKFENISSFNFTRDAFFDKAWDDQTMRARGLFIDTTKERIAARSYDKFFNINERPETKLNSLKKNLKFPVTAYVKENGFLGIVGYDWTNDKLLITSKSNPNSPFSDLFSNLLHAKVSPENIAKMKEYIKTYDVSFVFECVDMENDSHMIEYPQNELFLLDMVYNTMDFNRYEYDILCDIANTLGLKPKEKAVVLDSWDDFVVWYDEVTSDNYEYNGRYIEGFVIEDSDGFMTKLKLQYYKFWRVMRTMSESIYKNGGVLKNKAFLMNGNLAVEYYEWFMKLYKTDKNFDPHNICELRKKFYESR